MVDRLVTINALPDDTLFLIFSFHRRIFAPCYPIHITDWKWHRLAHVCRKWRQAIFASPCHLKLRLVVTGERHRTTLECWPPLPISLWSLSDSAIDLSLEVVTALKRSDCIHEISLHVTNSMFAESTAWVENSFPALEDLSFTSPHNPTVLPVGFLMGGSDGPPRRLRNISLRNVSFPHWLFPSSHDLVSLYLGLSTFGGAGLPSAEALAAALSETHHLESLFINPYLFNPCYPDQRSARPPSLTNNRVVLCALAAFNFDGPSSEYLEDLVSRIDAPILRQLSVTFPQHVFDLPQLSQFVSRTKHLNLLPHGISTRFYYEGLFIEHHFRHLESPHPRNAFSLKLKLRGRYAAREWTAAQVLHICGQLSPFTSSVERLWITIWLILDGEEDTERWFQLLGAFRGVQDLHLYCWHWHLDPAVCMERALEESSKREATQELFPVLRTVRMNEIRRGAWDDNHGIAAFVDARRRTGRPLVVCAGPGSVQKPED